MTVCYQRIQPLHAGGGQNSGLSALAIRLTSSPCKGADGEAK